MDDDLWEMLFFLSADGWTIVLVVIVLVLLSLFGVIPWHEWI